MLRHFWVTDIEWTISKRSKRHPALYWGHTIDIDDADDAESAIRRELRIMYRDCRASVTAVRFKFVEIAREDFGAHCERVNDRATNPNLLRLGKVSYVDE